MTKLHSQFFCGGWNIQSVIYLRETLKIEVGDNNYTAQCLNTLGRSSSSVKSATIVEI